MKVFAKRLINLLIDIIDNNEPAIEDRLDRLGNYINPKIDYFLDANPKTHIFLASILNKKFIIDGGQDKDLIKDLTSNYKPNSLVLANRKLKYTYNTLKFFLNS